MENLHSQSNVESLTEQNHQNVFSYSTIFFRTISTKYVKHLEWCLQNKTFKNYAWLVTRTKRPLFLKRFSTFDWIFFFHQNCFFFQVRASIPRKRTRKVFLFSRLRLQLELEKDLCQSPMHRDHPFVRPVICTRNYYLLLTLFI